MAIRFLKTTAAGRLHDTRNSTVVVRENPPILRRRALLRESRAVGFDIGVLQITLIAASFNDINRVADALGVGKPE